MSEPIEARAEQRAKAREHVRCGVCGFTTQHLGTHFWHGDICEGAMYVLPDHRTPAEQRTACLDALADAFALAPVLGDRLMIAQIYDSVRNRVVQ